MIELIKAVLLGESDYMSLLKQFNMEAMVNSMLEYYSNGYLEKDGADAALAIMTAFSLASHILRIFERFPLLISGPVKFFLRRSRRRSRSLRSMLSSFPTRSQIAYRKLLCSRMFRFYSK
jgi:hypothetical protein